MATQIETLLAVIAGSRRRPIYALITEVYPLIESDSTAIKTSINVPIDGAGAYLDEQLTSISGFSMEILDIIIAQEQSPDTLFANMTIGACDVEITTVTEVDQDQEPDVLASTMNTGVCDVTIVTVVEVEQDQKPDTLFANMTTGICSVTIT